MNNAIKILLTISLFLINYKSFSQQNEAIRSDLKPIHDKDISKLSTMQILEDSLVYFADSMYYSAFPENKVNGCYEFIRVLKTALNTPNSFIYPFPKLQNNIQYLVAPDKSFRIFNWEVMKSPAEKRYYAAIQMSDGNFIPLIDISDQIIRGAEDSVFTNNRWYGALYYNIIKKDLGGQSVYFLLGWNGNSLNSEKKIIDVFGFSSNGKAVFGAPLFNTLERGKRLNPNRFIIEYQKGAKLTMNYDTDADQIIFDHCESQIGDPAKKYTYIPDGTYDGLKWDGNSWRMYENVIQILQLEQGNAPVEKPIK